MADGFPLRLVTAAALLLAGWTSSRPGFAQETGGAIEGRVVEVSGAPVAEARVALAGPALIGARAVTCDSRGRFRLGDLPVGRYVASFARLGFRPDSLGSIVVELGRTTDVGDVRLGRDVIPLPETRVAAPRATLRPSAPGGTLSADVFRGLPADRDYQQLVTLLPHASASSFGDRANLAGTTGPESNYFVDGANVVEPPGNGVSTSLPYNLVRAIEVRVGSDQGPFGGAGGGTVNAVTAAGGDAFSGQVFGFFANRLFTSTSTALGGLPHSSAFSSWDAGGSAGGPVVRGRLWWFAAYDPALERAEVRLPGFGPRLDTRLMHRFAGKLTARLDDRTRVTLATVGDPSTRDQIGGVTPSGLVALANLDPVLVDLQGGGGTTSLSATRTLGAHAFAEAAASLTRARYLFAPVTERGRSEPLFVDDVTHTAEGGVGSATDRRAGRFSSRAALTVRRGAHALRAGAAWDDEWFRETLDLDRILRSASSQYLWFRFPDRRTSSHLRAPSAFAQDVWRIGDRLTLDAGLRWSDEYWMASGGELGQRVAGQWAPRARVTVELASGMRAFGAAGRTFQRTRLNFPGMYLQDVPGTVSVLFYTHDPRSDPSGGIPFVSQTFGHQQQVAHLRGATFDDLEIGADRGLPRGWHVTARALYRVQREGIVGALSTRTGAAVYGNPGRGELAGYPEIERRYRAAELTVEHRSGVACEMSATYRFSSLRGNDEGWWAQSAGENDPVGAGSFLPEIGAAALSNGPLPNDRPHEIKGWASFHFPRGFDVGATFLLASGTPISEFGATAWFVPPFYQLLRPRGSLGRTPTIYDLNLRLSHEWPHAIGVLGHPRLLADAYHLGNPREPVVIDELHYRAIDPVTGKQTSPNPHFGQPLQLQPAVAYRFGAEVSW